MPPRQRSAIDERAADLNRRLAVPDEDFERQDDDEVDDDDLVDEEGTGEGEEGGAGEEAAPPARPGQDSGPALSAGLVLGFVAYSAVIQLVRGGTDQLKGWTKAKLINAPYKPSGNPQST